MGGHHGGPGRPMGGFGGFRPMFGGWGMGHRPPPRPRGCCGCMLPVIAISAILTVTLLLIAL